MSDAPNLATRRVKQTSKQHVYTPETLTHTSSTPAPRSVAPTASRRLAAACAASWVISSMAASATIGSAQYYAITLSQWATSTSEGGSTHHPRRSLSQTNWPLLQPAPCCVSGGGAAAKHCCPPRTGTQKYPSISANSARERRPSKSESNILKATATASMSCHQPDGTMHTGLTLPFFDRHTCRDHCHAASELVKVDLANTTS